MHFCWLCNFNGHIKVLLAPVQHRINKLAADAYLLIFFGSQNIHIFHTAILCIKIKPHCVSGAYF